MSTQPQLSPLEQLGQDVQKQAPAQPTTPSELSPLELLGQDAQKQKQPESSGAPIQPVTTSTNPKLAAAESAKDMPEYVGATGALAAGAMGASVAEPAITAAIAHLGKVKAIID